MCEITYNRKAYKDCPNVTGGARTADLLRFGFTPEELATKRILSVAAGFGGTATLAGPQIYGIDPFMGRIGAPGPTVPFTPSTQRCVIGIAERLPFPTGYFDVAYSRNGVGYYPRQIHSETALREMLRVIDPVLGVVVFNWGQEMRPHVLNPVLQKFQDMGYLVQISGNRIFMFHPEYHNITRE